MSDAVKGLGEKVLTVLLEHRNQTVTLAQICKATGLEEAVAQRTVNNLKGTTKDLYEINVVLRGRAWVLRDVMQVQISTKKIFEEIGAAKDGSIVIQDSAGNLYRATEL